MFVTNLLSRSLNMPTVYSLRYCRSKSHHVSCLDRGCLNQWYNNYHVRPSIHPETKEGHNTSQSSVQYKVWVWIYKLHTYFCQSFLFGITVVIITDSTCHGCVLLCSEQGVCVNSSHTIHSLKGWIGECMSCLFEGHTMLF